MGHDKRLNAYNREILNWHFKVDSLLEFLRLLTDRNILIYEQTPRIDLCPSNEAPSKNETFIAHTRISNLEHIAFHVGFPHQRRLYSLVEENTNCPNNMGVFFTLSPNGVVYFSNFDVNPNVMVYFLDLNFAKGVRVQVNYESPVISRHDVDDLIERCHPRSKQVLAKKHRQLNKRWERENTIHLDVNKIKDLKQKGYDWLIVPDPIDIKY